MVPKAERKYQFCFLLFTFVCLAVVVSAASTKRQRGCLKPGDLCIPMITRLFGGSRYASESYCCSTTCLPLPPPIYGVCARFLPQIGGRGTTSTSAPPVAPSNEHRNYYVYY